MNTNGVHSRGLRRTVAVGLISIGTIAGGAAGADVANADCIDSGGQIGTCMALIASRGTPPMVDMQPPTMRAFCAVSSCYLVTEMPGAGIGGKP